MATTLSKTLNLDAVKAALVAHGLKPRLTVRQSELLDGMARGGVLCAITLYSDSSYCLKQPNGAQVTYRAATVSALPLLWLCDTGHTAYRTLSYTLKTTFIAA